MVPAGWFAALLVAAFMALYLRGLAGRLDRLHLRVEAAEEALDVQLLRRSSLVRELAETGWLDPATSLLLADAAQTAQQEIGDGRAHAESQLSKSLRTVLDEPGMIELVASAPGGPQWLTEMAASAERVVLARRFLNEAVRQTREVRGRIVVRSLRLAGHAQMPDSFEMDDAPSAELARFADSAA